MCAGWGQWGHIILGAAFFKNFYAVGNVGFHQALEAKGSHSHKYHHSLPHSKSCFTFFPLPTMPPFNRAWSAALSWYQVHQIGLFWDLSKNWPVLRSLDWKENQKHKTRAPIQAALWGALIFINDSQSSLNWPFSQWQDRMATISQFNALNLKEGMKSDDCFIWSTSVRAKTFS